jgi:beta-glucosidase
MNKENITCLPAGRFPKGFLWGAATASHQVEGNTHNNWSEWEKENAERLAGEAGGKWQKWQQEKFPEMFDPQNYISGRACDHYNRYEEDFDLAKMGGHNAHRFSIEWSRIEPEEGKFDEKEIEHYRNVILALKKRGIEPFVTVWHWTNPVWLEEAGGCENRRFPALFERYVGYLADSLGDLVKFWITLNEPDVVASHSFLKGVWPHQKKSIMTYITVMNRLAKTHRLAYAAMKNKFPQTQIGIAKHQVSFQVLRPTIINICLKKAGHYFWNRWFLNKINDCQDFIGLNHYNRNVVDNGFYKNPNERLTDFGWEFYPESIYQALIELKPYKKPIYITENGIADAGDSKRKEFLGRSLSAVHTAIADGTDVRGYLYWSFLDNFEWDKGFWPRFGLIEIDYKTLERKPRPSFYDYKKIIENNGIE